MVFISGPRLINSMNEGVKKLRNPYIDVYHWVKGELYDLESMKDVFTGWKAILDTTRKL